MLAGIICPPCGGPLALTRLDGASPDPQVANRTDELEDPRPRMTCSYDVPDVTTRGLPEPSSAHSDDSPEMTRHSRSVSRAQILQA